MLFCKRKGKAIPVIGRGGLQDCEMLRIPHCLDKRLTDGGKVCQLYAPAGRPLPLGEFLFSHLLEAKSTPFSRSIDQLEGLGKPINPMT
jgi:hypothetical protein